MLNDVVLGINNSSLGCDDVTAKIAKNSSDQYIGTHTALINVSLYRGIFPKELKTAKVIPIFKSGN